jgi:CBS domain-containing protein
VVDITDILMFVAFGNFNEVPLQSTPTPEQLSGEKMSFITVSDVVGAALQLQTGGFFSGVYLLKQQDTLNQALELSRGGVQRVLIDFGGTQFKILSQMDILGYLSICDEEWMEDVFTRKIESVTAIQRNDEFNELCTMQSSEAALTGFRRMLRNKADAVAVLNDDGKLVATLSPSDLRILFERTGSLKGVLLPVVDFLSDIHGSVIRNQLKVKETDEIRVAVFKCVLGKVHRVWVVDEEGRPKACLRVQDILDELREAGRQSRINA